MSCRLHSVEKPPAYLKNGVAGAVPPTGTRGGSPSDIAPFPRGRGLGLGIDNLLYFIKK